jgi:WD40 repeat protein
LAISPDGRLLASGSGDKTIKLWSLPDGNLLKTLTGHSDLVLSVAISPDGRLLASGSQDKTIKLWSLPDGAPLKTLTGHSDTVAAVVISPDGRLLASGSQDKTLKLWSLPDGKQLPVCLMDPAASCSGSGNGVTYTINGVSYTVPGGLPLPPGAVCTCNTVPFSACCSVGGCGSVYYYPN